MGRRPFYSFYILYEAYVAFKSWDNSCFFLFLLQYVAPGLDEKDVNVYFLPQKNSSELKFVLQFTVTFP